MTARILDLPADQYHRDQTGSDTPSLSKSTMHTLLSRSPAHARENHPRLNPNHVRVEEQTFDLGTAAHALFLQGETVVEIVDAKDWKQKWTQEARDLARAHGRIPMLTDQWTEVEAMVAAMRSQIEALDVDPLPFTAGTCEQTVTWEEAGVACRARLDWLHTDHSTIDDMKTSHNANPENWTRRTMLDIGADLQACFYRRGLKAATGIEPEFRFVVVEPKSPYALSVIALSPASYALAGQKIDYALQLWRRCLTTGKWPAYPNRVCYAEPPGWAESQWLEREAREEIAA